MEATCHECGNELIVESADLDGNNDLQLSVGLCIDCYDAVTEKSSGWEDRAMAAENDREHAQAQLAVAEEDLAEAQAEITKLNQQIEELGDLSGLH